jgi:hypothetical protein
MRFSNITISIDGRTEINNGLIFSVGTEIKEGRNSRMGDFGGFTLDRN